jgi:hypothetical protein
MQVRCIKAFGNAAVGEIVSGIPDGAAIDPEHWEVIAPDGPPAAPPVLPRLPVTPAAAVIPKEGM